MAQAPDGVDSFTAAYSAYFLGLKLMETELTGQFTGDEYEVKSLYRTGGLIAWAKKDEIVTHAAGRVDGERMVPAYYLHRDVLRRGRTVTMTYTPEDIEVTAEPPYSTLGDPPATQEDRQGSYDLVSGIMQISMNIGARPDYPCGPDVPIFDGKQRYDLRMAHVGSDMAALDGYAGPVTVCDVYYMPKAGFDADDIPKEKFLNTPLTVWFTEGDGLHVPVRFSYPVGIGTLVIEAKELAVTMNQASEHAERQESQQASRR